jgi:hypothetical protein
VQISYQSRSACDYAPPKMTGKMNYLPKFCHF